jgi:hypothetical protein
MMTNNGVIHRLTISGGYSVENWVPVYTNVKANIQPVSEELIAIGQGDFYNSYTIYYPADTDIQTGDKYRVDTVDFLIKGVQDLNFGRKIRLKKASAIKR